MAVKKRRRAATSPIERANQKSDTDFIASYMQPGAPGMAPWATCWTHPETGAMYDLCLARSACVGEAALESCFDLIEETSRSDYDASQQKWQPLAKRREMREADLRYILVREIREKKDGDGEDEGGKDDDNGDKVNEDVHSSEYTNKNKNKLNDSSDNSPDSSQIRGFTSLMPAYEEGQPVIYCYEIHLKPELHGTGLAGLLLGFLYTIAHNLPPISKVMLTCFLSNKRALRFYHKQGFLVDDISPEARILRGKTVVPDYTIMSKIVQR